MRVLLAYNHTLFTQGLQSLLKQDSTYEILGTAKDGHEVVELTRTLLPDLIIMDYSIPVQNSLISTKKIRYIHPPVKVILLSMHEEDCYVLQALQAGVSAYLLKNNVYQELKEALIVLKRGEIYLSPAVSNKIRRRGVL